LTLGLCLGEAHGDDLRPAVRGAWHAVVVERHPRASRDDLGARDSLCGRDVGQEQFAGHVADGPNTGNVRSQMIVDLDESAGIDLDSDLPKSQVLRVRSEPVATSIWSASSIEGPPRHRNVAP
jgi:hypothetical protein